MEKLDFLNPDKIHNWLASKWDKENYPHIIAGIDEDDCAVIRLGEEILIITTDFLNANPISKELGIATNVDLGRLLVASNLSDLLGSGALPIGMLLSVVLKKNTLTSEFKEIIEGVKYELDRYNIPLIGGDTKLGKNTYLCGTAIGKSNINRKLFLKNKAQIDDLVFISDEIGNVGAAVHGLSNNIMYHEWNSWAKNILITPKLPFEKSMIIANEKLGNGGTDISDGLGENLYDLCESSGVGVIIYSQNIPTSIQVKELSSISKIPPWFYPFSLGGDFQFIVTCNPKNSHRLKNIGLTEIGKVTRNKDMILDINNKLHELPRLGHTDFKIKNFAFEVNDMISLLKQKYHG